MDEAALPSYSVAEVQAGFKAHPEILVRTETIYEDGSWPKKIQKSIDEIDKTQTQNGFDKSRI